MNSIRSIMITASCFVLIGCGGTDGPKTVDVTGTVTLDGDPLPNATLMFKPEGSDNVYSGAYGFTDEEGVYSLVTSSNTEGAPPGKYRVEISTYAQPDEDEGTAASLEKIPIVYNEESNLVVDVTADGGPYDFELKSDAGQIVQPTEEED